MNFHGIPVKTKFNTTVLALVSFIVSIAAGSLLHFWRAGSYLAGSLLLPVGLVYVKLLFWLMVPLICTETVCGVMHHLKARRQAARPGRLWSFGLVNDLGAAVLGIVAAMLVRSPGLPVFYGFRAGFAGSLLHTFFPGLVLLSVVIGFAADKAGEEGEPARVLFRSLSGVFCRAGNILLKFLPAGVFLLLCPAVARYGAGMLLLPLKLVLLTVFCGLAYGFLVCGCFLYRCGRDCPGHFFRNFKPVLLQAFTDIFSRSVKDTMLRSLRRMGIVYPGEQEDTVFGRLFCGTGTVLYCAVACTVIAQCSGMRLSFGAVAGILIWVMLVPWMNPEFPGAGLFGALAVVTVTGLRPEAAVLLVISEWALIGIRAAVDAAFAGTGAYLADKLGWMKY